MNAVKSPAIYATLPDKPDADLVQRYREEGYLAFTSALTPQEVKDAFDDAIIAREDKQRFENDALGYASKQVPEARGAAARIKAESEAYEAQIVARAEGDAELALAMASHNAEPRHVETVRAMLSAAGFDENCLACGPHWPDFPGRRRRPRG